MAAKGPPLQYEVADDDELHAHLSEPGLKGAAFPPDASRLSVLATEMTSFEHVAAQAGAVSKHTDSAWHVLCRRNACQRCRTTLQRGAGVAPTKTNVRGLSMLLFVP